MSPHIKTLLVISALFLSNLACATLVGGSPATPVVTELPATQPPSTATNTEAPPPTGTPTPIAACPVITDRVMKSALTESEGEWETLDEEVYLVTYYVSGDDLHDSYYEQVDTDLQDEQHDTKTHQQIWDFFTAIIPKEWRKDIGEYAIVTDGMDGTLAAVAQTQHDANLWALEVDIADSNDYYSLTFTLIHEFGHLLTLGPDQVPPDMAVFNNPDDDNIYLAEVSKCPRYFPGEGCANADSYVNSYYEQFWAEIHPEWNEINLEENEDAYYARLDEFYHNHQDQFLTNYAATNPEEDMAETWAFFVLGSKPAGDTIAEKKILFFYQYPELAQLRLEMLERLCASFPK